MDICKANEFYKAWQLKGSYASAANVDMDDLFSLGKQ